MAKMTNNSINNLADIIEFLFKNKNESSTYWFRGHSDYRYELQPALFRTIHKGRKVYYEEATIIEEMVRRFPSIRNEHTSTLELLTYAQHYGLPTRLLDWSENLLVALYFCCKEKNKIDGEIFILNVDDIHKYRNSSLDDIEQLVNASFEIEAYKIMLERCSKFHKYFLAKVPPKLKGTPYTDLTELTDVELLLHFSQEDESPIEMDLGSEHIKAVDLYTYYAPMLNSRLVAQKGCFTVHGGKIINNKEIIKTSDLTSLLRTGALQKIRIPSETKGTILKELDLCGINEHTLFPEIEHQIEHIKSRSLLLNSK
ncbi:FRG domain-containing protein [Escherichia coli]|uniref:FRG domain-containing protein n=1 Tax=Escherichia coli TaxID=562 RepID=UPI00320FB4F4